MPTLIFPGSNVLELLAHAKAAPSHSAGYSQLPDPGPGLLLVKDAGIYLMSNGRPGLPVEEGKPGEKVVYAQGFEPAKTIEDRGGDWDKQYRKIQAAAGGDDFVEFIPEKAFGSLEPAGAVRITMTRRKLAVSVAKPRRIQPAA